MRLHVYSGWVILALFVTVVAPAAQAQAAASAARPGIVLGDLTWMEAERILTPDAASDVIMAPTINCNFYPAFVDYPGSTHLRFETARDLIVDVVHSLAHYGPRKFYVLNTGVSTLRPLEAAAAVLRGEGIQFTYTDVLHVAEAAEASVRQEPRGTHADEIETSMMLYMYPDRVDMAKAVEDDDPQGTGPLSRRQGVPGTTYSRSGVWGDATLATREKGRVVVEAMVAGMLREIEALRALPE